MIDRSTDNGANAAMHLHEVLLDPDWGTSYAPEKVPMAKALDMGGASFFEYFTQHVSFPPRLYCALW